MCPFGRLHCSVACTCTEGARVHAHMPKCSCKSHQCGGADLPKIAREIWGEIKDRIAGRGRQCRHGGPNKGRVGSAHAQAVDDSHQKDGRACARGQGHAPDSTERISNVSYLATSACACVPVAGLALSVDLLVEIGVDRASGDGGRETKSRKRDRQAPRKVRMHVEYRSCRRRHVLQRRRR